MIVLINTYANGHTISMFIMFIFLCRSGFAMLESENCFFLKLKVHKVGLFSNAYKRHAIKDLEMAN